MRPAADRHAIELCSPTGPTCLAWSLLIDGVPVRVAPAALTNAEAQLWAQGEIGGGHVFRPRMASRDAGLAMARGARIDWLGATADDAARAAAVDLDDLAEDLGMDGDERSTCHPCRTSLAEDPHAHDRLSGRRVTLLEWALAAA